MFCCENWVDNFSLKVDIELLIWGILRKLIVSKITPEFCLFFEDYTDFAAYSSINDCSFIAYYYSAEYYWLICENHLLSDLFWQIDKSRLIKEQQQLCPWLVICWANVFLIDHSWYYLPSCDILMLAGSLRLKWLEFLANPS